MVSGQPAQDEFHDQLTRARLQLKKHEPDPWPLREYSINQKPTTPSGWFSEMFPDAAKNQGCPFIELVEDIGDGLKRINPIAPNIDFLAAILGGVESLG